MSGPTIGSAETLAEAERTVAEAICRSIIDGNVLGGTHTVWTDWRPEAKAAIQALLASDWMKRHDAEVRTEALREVADAWTQGAWSDVMLPKPTPPAVPVIAYANRVGDWLRDRAALAEPEDRR